MDRPALRIDFIHRGTPRSEAYEIAGLAASAIADPHLAGRLDARGGYRWSLLDAAGGVAIHRRRTGRRAARRVPRDALRALDRRRDAAPGAPRRARRLR